MTKIPNTPVMRPLSTISSTELNSLIGKNQNQKTQNESWCWWRHDNLSRLQYYGNNCWHNQKWKYSLSRVIANYSDMWHQQFWRIQDLFNWKVVIGKQHDEVKDFSSVLFNGQSGYKIRKDELRRDYSVKKFKLWNIKL